MKLMAIDGNSIINRAFYGIKVLTTKDGRPTNAIYGFLNILQKMISEVAPDGICVAFDMRGPTFRHVQYEDYKAQRKGMPDELAEQMPVLKEILDAMNIPRYELEGYEADDLIGTIAARSEAAGWDLTIVTGDRDDLQLLSERVSVKYVSTRESRDYTPLMFEEEYGFSPEKLIDLKALMGDSSDNIPGVAGVGQKTAGELIRKFGSIGYIYDNLGELDIKDAVRKKLMAGKKQAFMSLDLATIRKDAPMEFEPEDTLRRPADAENLRKMFSDLEFASLLEKFKLSPASAEKKTAHIQTEYIRDERALGELIGRIEAADYVSVNYLENQVEIGERERISTATPLDLGENYQELLRSLFGGRIKKVGHNVKDIMRRCGSEGIPVSGFIFDTALAAYLISPTDSAYEPASMAERYFGEKLPDTAAIYRLYEPLAAKLSELGMDELYYKIELPLCAVLADMETAGFLVDRSALYKFGQSLSVGIERLQSEIYALADTEFNISSPKQLGNVLFERLMLPSPKKTKTGYSTNIEVLEKLRGKHEIIEKIIRYREYTKLKSTYADGLLKCIGDDGRIHTSFQMTVTATGRLSSTEPNLQNIPIRKELGGEIRKMFVAEAGNLLIDADYSQIELRLLAHISDDKTMRKAFSENEDIHTITASQVFDVPPEEVTSFQRSSAKAVNFGIVYGISDFSLSQDIGVTRGEARRYMDNYFAKYHGVRDYMRDIVEKAKKDGYVSTMLGRRRDLPELKASSYNVRSFGERVALNMPIQGAAADIIKLAMVNAHAGLKREGLRARLVLQVHDELIVEAPVSEAKRVVEILTQEMEQAVRLSVPLVAEAHMGVNWYEAH